MVYYGLSATWGTGDYLVKERLRREHVQELTFHQL